MLKDIAIKLRKMQLFYQYAHNMSKGKTFYQDHDAFGDYYEAVGGDYDMVIERAINVEGEHVVDLKMQLKGIYAQLKDLPTYCENEEFFKYGLYCEEELCKEIEGFIKRGCSVGVENLLGAVADKSEGRQYLINRRLKMNGPKVTVKKPGKNKSANKKY